MNKNDIININIESISSDGNGVGHYDGLAVFVPYSAVGDSLTVRIEKVMPRYCFGRILSIITPSENRVENTCPLFQKCGGCDFRHISYSEELRIKQDIVENALRRLGNISCEIRHIIGSPVEEEYRNKVQFPITETTEGLVPGFFSPRSHRIIPSAECCSLQPKVLNEIAQESCRLLTEQGVRAYNETSRKGDLRHILLRFNAAKNEILLCLVMAKGKIDKKKFTAEIVKNYPAITTIIINHNKAEGNVIIDGDNETIFGKGFIKDMLCGVPVNVTPNSFLQINNKSATVLYEKIKELADSISYDSLLDLYCGAGTIGLYCMKEGSTLYGIDVIEDSIKSAEKNAKLLGKTNTYFHTGDASYIKNLLDEGKKIDLIITDPPRKGCSPAVLDPIINSGVLSVIMVSCNPATLARDLGYLENNGFVTQYVQPVDLFPRTKHVENVVFLSRVESRQDNLQ